MEDTMEVMRRPSLYDMLGPYDTVEEEDINIESETDAAVRSTLIHQLTQEVTSRADALGCGQVMMPPGLVDEVTAQVLRLADSEPCGVRGGVLHINFFDGEHVQRLTRVVLDPSMPNTYEIYLTLRPDTTTWYHKMSRIIKPLRKSSPLHLSPDYKLEKKKLYPDE